MKKILSFILVVALLLVSVVAIPVYADDYDYTTTDDFFDLLQLYIDVYGVDVDGYPTVVQTEISGEYTDYYVMQNRGSGIYFDLLTTSDANSYWASNTEFILYKSSRTITVDFLMMYYYYGEAIDYIRGTKSIDIATYNPDNTYSFNYSGDILTSEQATESFNISLKLLCINRELYIYEELGFGLEELGFRNYPGLGDPVCDLYTNYHVGYADIRNDSEATCTKNGYTGDVYCTYCGNLAYEGEIIEATGHSYDNVCDKDCNNCGATRNANHNFVNDICTNCGCQAYVGGDVNGDGDINTTDLAMLKLFLAGVGDLSDTGKLGADLNGDGDVNTTDLAQLKLKLAGIE